MKNKTIPNLRIEQRDYENMIRAIEKFNNNSIVKMDRAGFLRLSIKVLSQMILTGQEIPLNFTK